jgi:predicted nucleic acid-binding protein
VDTDNGQDLKFIDFDNKAAVKSSNIYKQLKAQNKLIKTAAIFIAAIANNLSLATLNVKHFNRIESLKIIIYNFLQNHPITPSIPTAIK